MGSLIITVLGQDNIPRLLPFSSRSGRRPRSHGATWRREPLESLRGEPGTRPAFQPFTMRANRLIDLFNRLTTIKLSLQLLQRRANRGQDPDGLLDKALSATDDIISELREDLIPPTNPRHQPLPENPGPPPGSSRSRS
jgi:hypothetical protein